MGMLPRDIIIVTIIASMSLILISALLIEMRQDYGTDININSSLGKSLAAAGELDVEILSMEKNLFGQGQEVSIFTLTLQGVPAVINLFRQSLNTTRVIITESKDTLALSSSGEGGTSGSANILFTGLVAIMIVFIVFKFISAFTSRGDV